MSDDTLKCTCCGLSKKKTDYYASNNYIYQATGKLSVCKSCIWEYVLDGNSYDYKKLIDILQMIDKPYVKKIIEFSVEEAEKSNRHIFKVYMKNLGMVQNRDLRWKDSEFTDEGLDFNGVPSIDPTISVNEFALDEDTMDYWGRGYLEWEYQFLENEKTKLEASFECPDYGMEMIMKDICFINLEIEKIRQERKHNSSKEITALIKARGDLMNDANMKPIQSTGAEANDQVTFGTLIKKWENDRPVPPPLEDEMKEYIDTYIVGHLAKMDGLNNDVTRKYDEALSKHTINFSDISRDNDEFDD